MNIETHDKLTFGTLVKRTISAQLHFLGFMGALIGLGFLMNSVSNNGNLSHIIASLVFGITGISLFGASSLYHFWGDGFKLSQKLFNALKNFDHFSIYLFIAGTYTPVLFNGVSPWWRNLILILVWSIAALGIIYTWKKPKLPKWAQSRYVSTAIFLLMGWAIIFRIEEIWSNLSSVAIWLLVLGGASYTIGAIVYATKRPILFKPYFGYHELWHLLVLLGAAFHYFLVLSFYI